jgi:purine catabolism regulator
MGGAAGVNRRVLWATSLRLRPPAFEPHGGGEFVLASRAALESLHAVDAGLSPGRIVEGLAEAGAAALAVVRPAPADAIAAANAHTLPLLEVPEGLPLLDAERSVIGLVVDRHNALQARASQFYRQLAQLSVEDRGLDAIIHEAAAATGRVVAFEDWQFRLRVVAPPPGQDPPLADDAGLSSVDERGRLAQAVRQQPVSSTTPAAVLLPAVRWHLERYAAPVVTRERLRGFVSICAAPAHAENGRGTAQGGSARASSAAVGPRRAAPAQDPLTEFDQLAASRVAAICALELSKEDAVLAAEQRVQGDLVDELLRPYADQETVGHRARQAGLSPNGTFAIFAFGLAENTGPDPERTMLALADAVTRRLRETRRPSLLRPGPAELLVLCELRAGNDREAGGAGRSADGRPSVNGGSGGAAPAWKGAGPGTAGAESTVAAHEAVERRLRELAEDLFAVAARAVDGEALCAGTSRPHVRLGGLPHAALEAREALRIGRRVYGPGRLIRYADLGLYRVLHTLRDTPELRAFYEQTLGPLAEYDRKTGQNLIETLEAFFSCHGNLSQTAMRLQLHRNSLLYRIGRIQEVGGVDLEDPEIRLSLQVALKARRLLT